MAAAVALAFVLGLVIGSFLNVVAYRLPRGESLAHPPSRCPNCGAPVRPYDNIPVLSWLVLRGRCRNCGHPISARYPLVELTTGLLFAAVVLAKDDAIDIARGQRNRYEHAQNVRETNIRIGTFVEEPDNENANR